MILAEILWAFGSEASLISLSRDSHSLVDDYMEFLESAYTRVIAEYPLFDVRLKTLSPPDLGTLDPLSMT